MSNAAVYLRISDDRQGDAGGVTRQREDCLDYCERHGLAVAEVFEDNDVSASAYARKVRPGYRRMLAAAGEGQVDAIVTWHLDRLYRRPRELEDLIDLVEARAGKLQVRTLSGDFDLSSADGRAMARVMIAVAAKSSDDTSRRIRRKHLQLAQEGRSAGGGSRPFGYQEDRRTIREEEAARIRQAAARVLAGDSLHAIASDWQGTVPTVTGKPWRTQVLKELLTSARIAGLREHHGQITSTATWPAIITREEHEALRAILRAPGRRTNGHGSARRYLLTGFLVCALCGAKLVARPRDDGARCYVCASGPNNDGCGKLKRVAATLEQHVRDEVIRELDGPVFAAALRARTRDERLTSELTTAIRADEARLERLKGLLVDGDLAPADFRRFRGEIEERIAEASGALARLAGAGAVVGIPAGAAAATDWWEAAGLERQRAILGLVVERVVLQPARRGFNRFDPKCVEIVWKE